MGEWIAYQLGDIVSSNNKSIGKDYPHKKIYYLDTGSITRGKIHQYQELSIDNAPSRAKRLVKKKDIIYSNVRPIQRHYGFFDNPMPNMVASTGFSVIETNQNIAEPFYIYLFLTSDEIVETLDVIAEASTSTYPSLKPSDIENLDILLPPLPEQKAIASVLSSLDEKIDLLHRQNKTLEAMAETLFRQWFVEEAREDWEEGDIYKFMEVIYGYPFKSRFFNEEKKGYPLIRIRDLKKGFSDIYTDEECDEKYFIYCGDLIAGMDGEFRLNIWSGEKSVLNQRACKFVPKYSYIPYLFIFFVMKPHLHYYENIKGGTTVIHLGKSDLDEIKLLIPPKDLIIKYGEVANSLYEKIKINNNQIRTLEKLRDTLLPKLMSGEVRVEYEN